jgi:hypothetical protein
MSAGYGFLVFSDSIFVDHDTRTVSRYTVQTSEQLDKAWLPITSAISPKSFDSATSRLQHDCVCYHSRAIAFST